MPGRSLHHGRLAAPRSPRPAHRSRPPGPGCGPTAGRGAAGRDRARARGAASLTAATAERATAPPAVGRQPWQRYLAEFIGTFALVFAGCGAVISDAMSGGRVSPLGIALTFGFVIVVMIYALGPISAAHFNPAVTLGFAAARRFPWRYVPAYVGAQAGGALFASLLHRLLYGADLAAQAHYG